MRFECLEHSLEVHRFRQDAKAGCAASGSAAPISEVR